MNREIPNQRNPKKLRFDWCFTRSSLFYEQVKLSYGRYTQCGIRVRSKTRENDKFEKRTLSLKNGSPDSKSDFSFLFGIWRLILSRYDIKSFVYDIKLII